MSDPPVKPAARSRPPRVFLSYSHDSPEHMDRVLALADRLRSEGVEAEIDQYEPAPARGWPRWMEDSIEAADFVVVVCTETYLRRFRGREEPGRGLGVSWEGAIITQELYDAGGGNARFIPVVLEAPDGDHIPVLLRGATRYNLSREEGYEELYRRLTGQPKVERPELGKLRQLPVKDRKTGFLARPSPAYKDEALRQVSEALEAAWLRHETLTITGDDTSEVEQEISELKRRLRDGPELVAGDILGGRFSLLERIGEGGFATVWKAYDRRERGVVAVKVLHGQHSSNESRRKRFFRGARLMARVQHPGIVRVVEKHCEEDGYHFFVMEYVEGGDLREAVLSGRLDSATALEKVLEVAAALEAAHESKLIHRDVKPANILLDGTGRPKLTDFDLVGAFDSNVLTRTHAALGTFLYMAPEAMLNAKGAGVPADVYSLAMTAAFALHGAELPSLVLRHHEGFLRALRCREVIKEILLKATAIEPEGRFATVAEFLAAVRAALEEPDEPKPARSKPPRRAPEKESRPGRRGGDLVQWVEKEIPELPKAQRWAALLAGVERALPVDSGELRTVGILAWALDYFVGRSDSSAKRPRKEEYREALLEPLRKLRPPPQVGGKGWVEIPGGSFRMGSAKGSSDERPVHEVTVSDFSMLDHPVTNRELRKLIGSTRGEDELPAVSIDWYHAYAYAAWLGGRLPTEAEWEYACRAGTTAEYWSGDEEADLARVGWYGGNSDGRLHPVKKKPPNPWGLYDMHGNVWEWVADWYDSGWYEKPEASQPDPWGPSSGDVRVLRGGSCLYDAVRARAAYRWDGDPGHEWRNPGFRVVVPAAPEPVEP